MWVGNCKILVFALVVSVIGCKSSSSEKEPYNSLSSYKIEKGFDLKIIASEPFIEAPVTMDFDEKGRMWVVEMKGYMQNIEGTGEDMPNGVISILEDLDNDGVTDHAKVFLDNLVLPRAIAHVYGGLLYSEPPNLWFVDIKDDKPINKVLVDSLYATGGNVEHQPNGLMMNIDNWIYNAKSSFRYQRKNGIWKKEATSFRGQWGISKDNFGRLYYNNNSVQLIGDYVLPNTFVKNKFYKPKEAINKALTKNQKVYPLHATSVNRGYIKGVLDKDSLVVNVTASCGPLVYRGNQFQEDYFHNAFVCVPEANLIKRNILSFKGDKINAKQAYENKEFIVSTDEGFRPVNLFNGPDGAMYIVDMHRGIIQDKAYLTSYLQNHMVAKKLDTIIGMGRVLKVSNANKPLESFPILSALSISELVAQLKSTNPWIRDKTQQLLILKKDKESISLLENLVVDKTNPLAQIHGLHTLKGLDKLTFELLVKVVKTSSPDVIAHSLVLLEKFASKKNAKTMISLVSNLIDKNNKTIDLYLGTALGKWVHKSDKVFFPFINKLSNRYKENAIYQESIVSGLGGMEQNYLQEEDENSNKILIKKLKGAVKNRQKNSKNGIYVNGVNKMDSRTAGYKVYQKLCALCHGANGDGIAGVAPPFRNSEYVLGSEKRLALIILHGLKGPVHVNGKLYKLNGTMPGLIANKEYGDKDIANVISYMQNAFVNGSKKRITAADVKALRNVKPKDGTIYTEVELLKLKDY